MGFVKGQSGNPHGRPKGAKSLSDVVRRTMVEVDPATGKTNQERIVMTLWSLAIQDRSLEAIKVLFDRIDGKVPNAPDQSSDDETILAVADL